MKRYDYLLIMGGCLLWTIWPWFRASGPAPAIGVVAFALYLLHAVVDDE